MKITCQLYLIQIITKNINNEHLDLREINKIIKKNSKSYNFSKINDELISEKTNLITNQKYKVLDLFAVQEVLVKDLRWLV